MTKKSFNVICPYCNKEAELTTGKEIYPKRKDLFKLNFWICRECKAYVGCHRPKVGQGNGTKPMGTLANQHLRSMRSSAHRHFDPIWKDGPMTRNTAYLILANSLEIPVKDCHISQFGERLCEQTIRICKRNKFTKSARGSNG